MNDESAGRRYSVDEGRQRVDEAENHRRRTFADHHRGDRDRGASRCWRLRCPRSDRRGQPPSKPSPSISILRTIRERVTTANHRHSSHLTADAAERESRRSQPAPDQHHGQAALRRPTSTHPPARGRDPRAAPHPPPPGVNIRTTSPASKLHRALVRQALAPAPRRHPEQPVLPRRPRLATGKPPRPDTRRSVISDAVQSSSTWRSRSIPSPPCQPRPTRALPDPVAQHPQRIGPLQRLRWSVLRMSHVALVMWCEHPTRPASEAASGRQLDLCSSFRCRPPWW